MLITTALYEGKSMKGWVSRGYSFKKTQPEGIALKTQPEGIALKTQPEGIALKTQPEGIALKTSVRGLGVEGNKVWRVHGRYQQL